MPTEGSGDPAPDALEPEFHGVRAHWIPGFMAFHSTPETLRAQVIRLAVSDIVIFMGQCGR